MARRVPLAPIGPIEFDRPQSGPSSISATKETTVVEVSPVSRSLDDDLLVVDMRRYDDATRAILESSE